MRIYMYGNYISSDKEKLEERISEDIACNVKSIASVEALTESACEDIEEIVVNPQDLIRYMKTGYHFIEYARDVK